MAVDTNLSQFPKDLDKAICKLTQVQADALAKQLSASFIFGWELEHGDKISLTQERAIQKMTASQLGYLTEFNSVMGAQIAGEVKRLMAEGVMHKNIAKEMIPYVYELIGPDGKVVIDHIGQKRSIIRVGKDRRLRRIEKTITRKYTTNPQAYADMLARTSTHNALEQGRAEARQSKGITKWRFSGPIDERSRPDHAAIVGNVYEYGTDQSDMAQQLLSEPNCRHRSIEYFDDKELDTPDSHYDDLKKDGGLEYKDGEWILPEAEL